MFHEWCDLNMMGKHRIGMTDLLQHHGCSSSNQSCHFPLSFNEPTLLEAPMIKPQAVTKLSIHPVGGKL